MTNHILLLENESLKCQTAGFRNHIEISLNRTIGAKLELISTLAKAKELAKRKDCVFAIPISLPSHFTEIGMIKTDLERSMPLTKLIAICFLLLPEKKFTEESLLSAEWVNTLDAFYDQAIPTQFVFLGDTTPSAQSFHMSASMASLFRDIDNLKELQRIESTLTELESRIAALENQNSID
jgi:hypothetical protein